MTAPSRMAASIAGCVVHWLELSGKDLIRSAFCPPLSWPVSDSEGGEGWNLKNSSKLPSRVLQDIYSLESKAKSCFSTLTLALSFETTFLLWRHVSFNESFHHKCIKLLLANLSGVSHSVHNMFTTVESMISFEWIVMSSPCSSENGFASSSKEATK